MYFRSMHNFLLKICSRRRAARGPVCTRPLRWRGEQGVTLIDTLVGISLMLVIFLGIVGAFQLSIDVVTNNKARGGAIALADQRMEYVRSLSYASVGTVGGIPSGNLVQSETILLNGVAHTRRTVVVYGDDPKDGTGGSDANQITSDYKAVKVDVSWTSRNGTRHITIVSRLEPPAGMEIACTPPCGTLVIDAVNAASQPVSGASVSIVNPSTSPAINISTFTDSTGAATLIGAPAASGYQITVTATGYSTAQTYSTTVQNTNPNPGNLTVSDNQTTTGTFAIDALGSKTVKTWTQILPDTWTDTLANDLQIATSSNVTVAGGSAALTSNAFQGEVQSVNIAPGYLNKWKSLSWNDTQPTGSSIVYRVYDGGGNALIPDAMLPGNSTGFTTSPVSLLDISTTTHQQIRVDAALTPGDTESPSVDSWSVDYDYGPQPLPDIAFTMQGNKTIGSGPSGPVYKYSQANSITGSGSVVIPNLEWDTYTLTLTGGTYDIASSCQNPQPESLLPGASDTTDLYLAPHTANSLLVDVRAAATGILIQNASLTLTLDGFSANATTDACGQAFFSDLSASATYSITVSAPGFTTYNGTNINVSGTSRTSATLN